METLTNTTLDGLKLLSRGKVRDVYETSDPDQLLFVASDRISAYDVILNNGIPGKGAILTQMSLFWFEKLKNVIPNHFITANVEDMPAEIQLHAEKIKGRSMLVRRAKVIPIEAITRGYITGSAWAEYKTKGTMHNIQLPEGLKESEKLPQPVFTPSTKAEAGQHDENIHPDTARNLVGVAVYDRVSSAAVELYARAAEYALAQGVIIADTKFEFGLVPCQQYDHAIMIDGHPMEVILVDEVLTPDSSRFWPASDYKEGITPPSYDKQYLRDWMRSAGFVKGLEEGPDGQGWTIPPDVLEGTKVRYEEALQRLLGNVNTSV
ncbi:Bifunctional purine biosynthetic protein ade1 [Serendipita sp. 396]|nr:Bifunctional purine biosynthetic protein ade1 [Serendipita sp. 396]KAG8788145.1 Bifunctional purine biosynthetic protein ade1 [Serendipita sp. 397]KAG8874433.1 Bifunctional purine biosynthetic protein ade1 [Serendipita sp. 405]